MILSFQGKDHKLVAGFEKDVILSLQERIP